MKGYYTFPKAAGLKLTQFSVTSRHSLGFVGFSPRQGIQLAYFEPSRQGGKSISIFRKKERK